MRYKKAGGTHVFVDAWEDHGQAAGNHVADVFYGACMKWNCMCAAYVVPTSKEKNTEKRGGPFCERCGYPQSDHQQIRIGTIQYNEYLETLVRMKKASALAGKQMAPMGGFIKAPERLPPLQETLSSHTKVGERRQNILQSIQGMYPLSNPDHYSAIIYPRHRQGQREQDHQQPADRQRAHVEDQQEGHQAAGVREAGRKGVHRGGG
jgi:hypothetical protein